MKRKKSLTDFWACIFLIGAGLMFYFAHDEPQADIAVWYRRIAWAALVAFAASIGWSKWKLGAFFSSKAPN